MADLKRIVLNYKMLLLALEERGPIPCSRETLISLVTAYGRSYFLSREEAVEALDNLIKSLEGLKK